MLTEKIAQEKEKESHRRMYVHAWASVITKSRNTSYYRKYYKQVLKDWLNDDQHLIPSLQLVQCL